MKRQARPAGYYELAWIEFDCLDSLSINYFDYDVWIIYHLLTYIYYNNAPDICIYKPFSIHYYGLYK